MGIKTDNAHSNVQSARLWNKTFILSSHEEKCVDNKCLLYTNTCTNK